MPYDDTDTARAAEKLGRDFAILDANEEAAYTHISAAALCAMLAEGNRSGSHEDFARDADALAVQLLKLRRRRTGRLVAGRVGQPRLTEHERRVIVAACEAVWDEELTPRLIGAVKALASVQPERHHEYHASPLPSALTPEQQAVIDAARAHRKVMAGQPEVYGPATGNLAKAVDALNAAEGRP